MDIDLRSVFSPASIASALELLPPVRTQIMDLIYPEAKRVQHPLPVLGVNEISRVIKNMPVVRRGTPAVPMPSSTQAISYIEPQPVDVEDFVTATELNNMKLLNQGGIDQWRNNKVELHRSAIRATCEALCGMSLSGALAYPMKVQGGYDTYSVSFGSILTSNPTTLWDDGAKTLAGILADLIGFVTTVQDAGAGSQIIHLCGITAFTTLANEVISLSAKGNIAAEVNEKGINIAGFVIRLATGTYYDYLTSTTVKFIGDKELFSIAIDAPFKFYYCAIDDIEAGLLPMPLFISQEVKKNPSGVELIGHSKPFPVPVPKAICKSTVIA
ncbi:MAG: hypothetical protein A3J97_10700 [Spirochaetes bacterium RIFOXYC1_FULL_54_7]|nr:MAG: hypothetical protein A3J97_10700 [Spirochaetes bacterium RIFOXYC1_FULL_54_7]